MLESRAALTYVSNITFRIDSVLPSSAMLLVLGQGVRQGVPLGVLDVTRNVKQSIESRVNFDDCRLSSDDQDAEQLCACGRQNVSETPHLKQAKQQQIQSKADFDQCRGPRAEESFPSYSTISRLSDSVDLAILFCLPSRALCAFQATSFRAVYQRMSCAVWVSAQSGFCQSGMSGIRSGSGIVRKYRVDRFDPARASSTISSVHISRYGACHDGSQSCSCSAGE